MRASSATRSLVVMPFENFKRMRGSALLQSRRFTINVSPSREGSNACADYCSGQVALSGLSEAVVIAVD